MPQKGKAGKAGKVGCGYAVSSSEPSVSLYSGPRNTPASALAMKLSPGGWKVRGGWGEAQSMDPGRKGSLHQETHYVGLIHQGCLGLSRVLAALTTGLPASSLPA